MYEILSLASSFILASTKIQLTLLLLISYTIYYFKYGFYIFRQKKTYTQGKHRMGKTLPAYPNGWFIILRSYELRIGEAKYIDSHGESLVVFRGNNSKSYVLSAYCAHLGANLGIEGRVVHDSCIQCPFHAWTFDGETGNCVVGKEMKVKEGIQYEYQFDADNKCEFKQCKTEKIKIKKYLSQEHSGFIYVWFSAKQGEVYDGDDDKTTLSKFKAPYEPFNVADDLKRLDHRGYSLNIINTHISDIAENGGDMLHFLYIHSSVIPYLVTGRWDAFWLRGDDPQLKEKMTLKNKTENDYRMMLINKYLTEENKKYVGVIHIQNELNILGVSGLHFFTLTGFQVGPGLVYLFIKGKFFETLLIQHITTKEKYNQDCYHEIFSNWASPYWFSALQLRLEVRQVLNDGVVWDNKKFSYKANFNKNNNDADNSLITWRKWFVQFYEGCKDEESKRNSLGW